MQPAEKEKKGCKNQSDYHMKQTVAVIQTLMLAMRLPQMGRKSHKEMRKKIRFCHSQMVHQIGVLHS